VHQLRFDASDQPLGSTEAFVTGHLAAEFCGEFPCQMNGISFNHNIKVG